MRINPLTHTFLLATIIFISCESTPEITSDEEDGDEVIVDNTNNELTGLQIDLDNLFDYESLTTPNYITKDNTRGNYITNEGAVLGRVLFYDVKLSTDNSVACASCHRQQFAFGDDKLMSDGVAGETGRHSMRLVNVRFAEEDNFFWDERAGSLEEQTTMPIQDHVEMGFSGEDGNPDFTALIEKLEAIENYPILFNQAFGSDEITEERIQDALAQFIRSIQSFDSKYDEGRAQVNDERDDFPNFTEEENLGKRLFMNRPPDGGAGCNACHRAPEFDIDPNSMNNGVIGVAGSPDETDLTNERAPSLRDLMNPNGVTNGPMMHDGSLMTLEDVVRHYNNIDASGNNNLDERLEGRNGNGLRLNLDDEEIDAIVSFLETLTGEDMYTAEQWSDPFQ